MLSLFTKGLEFLNLEGDRRARHPRIPEQEARPRHAIAPAPPVPVAIDGTARLHVVLPLELTREPEAIGSRSPRVFPHPLDRHTTPATRDELRPPVDPRPESHYTLLS